ncbi:MAG: aminotransferase class IV [Candidatus Bilamarchaeum sp.]
MTNTISTLDNPNFVKHAPYVSVDGNLVPWVGGFAHLSGVGMQYASGCLDGMVHSVGLNSEGVPFVAIPDFYRHLARHMRNSRASVLLEPVSDLESAYSLGLEGKSEVRLPFGHGRELTFEDYQRLYLRYLFASMDEGRVDLNYSRPFYFVTDAVSNPTLLGPDNSFAIDPTIYDKSLALMFERWPALLAPRDPEFAGLTVLLTDVSLSPAPGTSFIEYKSSSSYQPSRGRAVKLKNEINARFASELGFMVNDVLLLDHTGKFVREASGSNCFILRPDGSMTTPRTDGSIFPGLTRQFVFDLAETEVGQKLNLKITQENLYAEALQGGVKTSTLFLTGSALGLIPVRRLLIPKVPNPQTKDDFRVVEFAVSNLSRIIADCYRAFSLGFGFEVETTNGRARADMSNRTLRVELDRDMHEKAVEFYRQKRDAPLDMIMRSSAVRTIEPRLNRVATRSNLIV